MWNNVTENHLHHLLLVPVAFLQNMMTKKISVLDELQCPLLVVAVTSSRVFLPPVAVVTLPTEESCFSLTLGFDLCFKCLQLFLWSHHLYFLSWNTEEHYCSWMFSVSVHETVVAVR